MVFPSLQQHMRVYYSAQIVVVAVKLRCRTEHNYKNKTVKFISCDRILKICS